MAYETVFRLPFSWIEPYVHRIVPAIRRAALDPTSIEWGLTVRPPGRSFAAYHVFRREMSERDRREWLSQLRVSMRRGVHLERESTTSGFERWRTSIRQIRRIASDGEHVVIVPEVPSNSPLQESSRRRIERLVRTARGDRHPHHCFHRDARILVERLPPRDLVFAWFRTDGATFDSNPRIPTGARASAFALRLNEPARQELTGPRFETITRTPSIDGTHRHAVAKPTASGRTARTGGTSHSVPAVDVQLLVVFPRSAVDVDAVRDHVRGSQSVSRERGVRFDDPRYDRSGRLVIASETIPLSARG